jgi:hypothetical protein
MPTKAAKPKAAASKPSKAKPAPASKAPQSKAPQSKAPPSKAALSKALGQAGIRLTQSQNETFRSQTIHAAGHGYVKCTFDGCTFVVTNAPFSMTECSLRNCNWRIEIDVLAGDPRATQNLRLLLQIIEGPGRGNRQAPAARAAAASKTRAATASKKHKASDRPEIIKQK